MRKIFLVIQREYLARVRKKSFLLTTILTPLVFPAILGLFLWISTSESGGDALRIIEVVDETEAFFLESNGEFAFSYSDLPADKAKEMVVAGERYGFLHIPPLELERPEGILFYSEKSAPMGLISELEGELKRKIEEIRLYDSGIDPLLIKQLKTNVNINSITLEKGGVEKASNSAINYGLGFFLGILIYTFIFIYGNQVMQGVIEEKSSRIIEILVSSIRPFELMVGKVLGIGAVSLTQFLIWILLMTTISTVVMGYFGMQMPQQQAMEMAGGEAAEQMMASGQVGQFLVAMQGIDFVALIFTFLFYFLGGYLLYGAVFAAIGAAVDSPSDAQQFMLPVTIPLMASYFGLFIFILDDPNSQASFWLSVIPLTSPIAMVGRASFGIPAFDLILSMTLLILGFLFTAWVAGKIYRIGILVHGTKVNYRTLWKWIKQSN